MLVSVVGRCGLIVAVRATRSFDRARVLPPHYDQAWGGAFVELQNDQTLSDKAGIEAVVVQKCSQSDGRCRYTETY